MKNLPEIIKYGEIPVAKKLLELCEKGDDYRNYIYTLMTEDFDIFMKRVGGATNEEVPARIGTKISAEVKKEVCRTLVDLTNYDAYTKDLVLGCFDEESWDKVIGIAGYGKTKAEWDEYRRVMA